MPADLGQVSATVKIKSELKEVGTDLLRFVGFPMDPTGHSFPDLVL